LGVNLVDHAAVFIDSGYLSKVLKYAFKSPKIDFEKFSDHLCGDDCARLRTYYYDCMPYQDSPPTEEQRKRYSAHDSFLYNLRKLNRFEVRLGKLIYIPKSKDFVQKRVDVLLSVDLVRMSWDHQIQKAILVTGDSDFVPAIQAAKDAGVLAILYYSKANPQVSALDELLYACDERIEISQKIIDACKRS
jgi:uncharacterized LabA/DUF88 family protein